ncbi:MAG: LysM peptidoglycan-binding domain-containing protein [Candidatus Blackburnbacteria bacterium]|nr:LysM peptidoglycan-binding domain-containing protein [Candidatus Blackburnbacteria bacterium]
MSEKYYGSGYNWVDIAEANSLANANLILVDQELTVPNAAVRQPASTTPAAQAPQSTTSFGEPIQGNSYQVVTGDHLWGIAVRAYGDGYQWVKIWRENKSQIKNPNLIYPAQEFKIPR